MVIGDWKATAFELGPDERAMAGAVACLSRVYTNPGRGLSVSVLLLGGLPGKISTHTPDVCYTGRRVCPGLVLALRLSIRKRRPATAAEFQTAVATRGGRTPPSCESSGAGTPPRVGGAVGAALDIGSEPALCKLYVIRETAGAVVDPGADPCNEFLNVFLPEVDRLVFSHLEVTRR